MHRERLSPTLPETQMSRCWLSGGPEGQYDMATRSLFCGQHVKLLRSFEPRWAGWPLCATVAFSLDRFWEALPTSQLASWIKGSITNQTGNRTILSTCQIQSFDVCHQETKSKTEPLHPTAVISGLPTPFPTMTVLDQHRWPHTSPGTTASPSAWNIFRGAENCWGPNQGCYSSCPSTQPLCTWLRLTHGSSTALKWIPFLMFGGEEPPNPILGLSLENLGAQKLYCHIAIHYREHRSQLQRRPLGTCDYSPRKGQHWNASEAARETPRSWAGKRTEAA